MLFDITKKLFCFILIVNSIIVFFQENTTSISNNLLLSFSKIQTKTTNDSKKIHLNSIETNVTREEISESKTESFLEIKLKENHQYATTVTVYENGQLSCILPKPLIKYL